MLDAWNLHGHIVNIEPEPPASLDYFCLIVHRLVVYLLNMRKMPGRQIVRILLLGERMHFYFLYRIFVAQVGKTTLILSLVSEEFSHQVSKPNIWKKQPRIFCSEIVASLVTAHARYDCDCHIFVVLCCLCECLPVYIRFKLSVDLNLPFIYSVYITYINILIIFFRFRRVQMKLLYPPTSHQNACPLRLWTFLSELKQKLSLSMK